MQIACAHPIERVFNLLNKQKAGFLSAVVK